MGSMRMSERWIIKKGCFFRIYTRHSRAERSWALEVARAVPWMPRPSWATSTQAAPRLYPREMSRKNRAAWVLPMARRVAAR